MFFSGPRDGVWVLGLFLWSCLSSSLMVTGSENEKPVAERRFLDWFKKEEKKESAPPQEGYGAGFGMYPLWKFHKFDGFSLRPVPMNLDLGYGIPPPPPTMTPPYPQQQAPYGGGQSYGQQGGYAPYSGYGQGIPLSGYGQSGPSSGNGQSGPPSGYGQSAQPSGYGQSAPPSGYGQNAPPSGYGQNAPPATYGQGGYDSTPIQIAYQPVPQNDYQPNNYGPPSMQNYPSPELSYSPSNNVAATVLPASGGFGSAVPKVPSYASFEGSVPFSGLQGMPMSMDGKLGGYMKEGEAISSSA